MVPVYFRAVKVAGKDLFWRCMKKESHQRVCQTLSRRVSSFPSHGLEPKDLARKILEFAWSKNAYCTRVLDVSKLVNYTDIFILVNGRSERHCLAIAEEVEKKMKEMGISPWGVEGKKAGTWVLMDYGSVILHIFEKNTRQVYDLDKLWADAEVIETEEPLWVKEFAKMEEEQE